MKILPGLLVLVSCATVQPRAVRPPLKPLEQVLAQAEVAPCTAGLHPIPATVIDVGTLKHVPYQSFSNGTVELNAYGDPDHLAALEVGTASIDAALRVCLAGFLAEQLTHASDQQAARAQSVEVGALKTGRVLIEVTPPEASDAYGAWWVTYEVPSVLRTSSADPGELQALTSSASDWTPPPPPPSARTAPTVVISAPPYSGVPSYSSYRPRGGPVYVHGYVRKNGTYVAPHTRRR